MLDVVQEHAQKWRYSLHPGKSKIMVFGCRNPPPSCWKLGNDTIEVVEHLHLGILHSMKSTVARTILQTSRGRSVFFALNRFGTRFGCTHPLTALRLYQAISLPRMLYGAPLWNISNSMKGCIGRFSGQFNKMPKSWSALCFGSELGQTCGEPIGNPSCKPCNSGEEDPVHFLAACNALQAERQSLLSHAPLNLPVCDLAHDPIAFTEIMLGVDWIDDLEAQVFFIQFITDLKQKRSKLLINQP